jgi:hypothetical protein
MTYFTIFQWYRGNYIKIVLFLCDTLGVTVQATVQTQHIYSAPLGPYPNSNSNI